MSVKLSKLSSLIGLAGPITGKKYASGTSTTDASGTLSVTGLTFIPKMVKWYYSSNRFGYSYNGLSPSLFDNGGTGTSTTGLSFSSNGFTVATNLMNTSVTWEVWE